MRFWRALCLVLFLSLQFSWAAVAGYCQHQSDLSPAHFGHHVHDHGAAEAALALSAKSVDAADEGAGALGVDADCVACHAACASALPWCHDLSPPRKASVAVAYHPVRWPAPPGQGLDRPQWLLPA